MFDWVIVYRSVSLAFGLDGSLWTGINSGLGHFDRAVERTTRIIDVIGKDGEVTQGRADPRSRCLRRQLSDATRNVSLHLAYAATTLTNHSPAASAMRGVPATSGIRSRPKMRLAFAASFANRVRGFSSSGNRGTSGSPASNCASQSGFAVSQGEAINSPCRQAERDQPPNLHSGRLTARKPRRRARPSCPAANCRRQLRESAQSR